MKSLPLGCSASPSQIVLTHRMSALRHIALLHGKLCANRWYCSKTAACYRYLKQVLISSSLAAAISIILGIKWAVGQLAGRVAVAQQRLVQRFCKRSRQPLAQA